MRLIQEVQNTDNDNDDDDEDFDIEKVKMKTMDTGALKLHALSCTSMFIKLLYNARSFCVLHTKFPD